MPLDTTLLATLAAADCDASSSLAILAKRSKLKEHQVRYALDKLQALGILEGKVGLVDPWKVGYRQFTLHFSIASRVRSARKQLLAMLVSHPRVCWISELAGRHQYALTMLAARASEVQSLLEEVRKVVKGEITQRAIGERTSFSIYPRRYLSPRLQYPHEITFVDKGETEEIDGLDKRILKALGNPHSESPEVLARTLSVPSATMHRRIRSLTERGILARSAFRIHLGALGIRRHRVLLSVRSVSESSLRSLRDFAKASFHLINLSQTLGTWDFDLSFEHFSDEEFLESLQELGDALGGNLIESDVSTVLKYHKFSTFPFRDS